MVDLHVHTKHSDGDHTVTEILEMAEQNEIEVLSITDHNSVGAHLELRNIDQNEFFSGKIITGCEFTTSYNGIMIEVVGHKLDVDFINDFITSYYTKEKREKRKQEVYDKITGILKDLGINYGDVKITDTPYTLNIFNEIIKDETNFYKLDEDVFNSYSDFMRKGLYNSKSKLYIDYGKHYPSLQETIDLVHKAGGVCFLAHPFLYPFQSTEATIEKMYNEYNLDGIECFHDTAAEIGKIDYLLDFANRHSLLISGGSDFHGMNNEFNSTIGHGINKLDIDIKYVKWVNN